MAKPISWTKKEPDGVKREVRVALDARSIKWQYKRNDEEKWDYKSTPRAEDWAELHDILERRCARGRQPALLKRVRRLRNEAGA
ncbi:MAG: hypothetical protein ACI9OU_000536 [Candidatus Promineifilaceae bacterium]|jgi:carbonic anhydrase